MITALNVIGWSGWAVRVTDCNHSHSNNVDSECIVYKSGSAWRCKLAVRGSGCHVFAPWEGYIKKIFIFERRCNEGQYHSHCSHSFRHMAPIVTVIIHLVSKFWISWYAAIILFVAVCAGMSPVSMSYSHFVVIREVKKFSHMEVNVCYLGPRIFCVESSNAEVQTLS